ncbi:MAG: hypothetical protein ACRBBP_02685 [Bdellovibrionales bacterium]
MNSKVIPFDVLKREETRSKSETVDIPIKETKEEKLLRLESLFEQGLYNPNLEDVAEALINKLVAEEEKNTKK